jgi:hypothetical protein
MKRIYILILGLLFLIPLQGQILRYSYHVTVTPPSEAEILLADGHTVEWFISNSAYVDLVGDTAVSQWEDISGNDHHLVQANTLYQPHWIADGIQFSTGHLLKTGTVPINQPVFIYLVIRQDTWGANEYIFTNYANANIYMQQRTATPQIRVLAGTASGNNANLAVSSFGIVRILFSGASSRLQVNATAATTGDFGATAMDGIAIPLSATTGGAGVTIKEIIIRDVDDTGDDETVIYNYLKAKYGL